MGLNEEPSYVYPVVAEALVGAGPRSIEARKPREATLALEMLAMGARYDEVCEETGLTFNQVASLKARHNQTVEVRRQVLAKDGFEMAEKLRLLTNRKLEMMAEDDDQLKKASLKDLTLSYAIAQDKAFSAMGEATKVVEVRAGKPTLEDARKAIEEAREALQKEAIPVEANENTD
jgi:hypothetical protein